MQRSRSKDVYHGALVLTVLAILSTLTLATLTQLWSPVDESKQPAQIRKRELKAQAAANALYGQSSAAHSTSAGAAPMGIDCVPERCEYWTFFGKYDLSSDEHVIWLVLLSGAIGASLHGTVSVVMFLGAKRFRSRWSGYYYTRPLVGASLGLIVYLLLRAGFMPSVGLDGVNPYGPVAVSALMGLFSRPALDKLKQVFETMFTPPGQSTDPLDPPKKLSVTVTPKRVNAKKTDAKTDEVEIAVAWPKNLQEDAQITIEGVPPESYQLGAETLEFDDGTSETKLVFLPGTLEAKEYEVLIKVAAGDAYAEDKLKLVIK